MQGLGQHLQLPRQHHHRAPHRSAGGAWPAARPPVQLPSAGRSQQQQQQQQPPSAALLEAAPVSPDTLTCSHPDAVRRRMEQNARRRMRDTERRKSVAMGELGLRWFEGHQPPNMQNVRSPAEYKRLLMQANAEGRLLVAKFFTEDCYVCKTLYPKLKRMAGDHPDVLWAKLNGSDPEMVELFQAMDIKKVPYVHMVRNGQLVSELSVSLSMEKMSKFRAELAAHRPASRQQLGGSLWQQAQGAGGEGGLAAA